MGFCDIKRKVMVKLTDVEPPAGGRGGWQHLHVCRLASAKPPSSENPVKPKAAELAQGTTTWLSPKQRYFTHSTKNNNNRLCMEVGIWFLRLGKARGTGHPPKHTRAFMYDFM